MKVDVESVVRLMKELLDDLPDREQQLMKQFR